MAFQIKNFLSVAASLINHMRGTQTAVTDFNVGAVGRTMLEAAAVEVDELYQQMFNGLMEAIPVATYRSFNFDTLPPRNASGLAHVVIAPSTVNVLIGAGTVFSNSALPVSYISQTDVIILAGSTTADVLVAAATAGVVGNIPSSTPFVLTPTPAGLVSAANTSAFINGLDSETPDQKKQRFNQYISTLQRATVAAIEYGATTAALYDSNGVETERVKAVSVIEPYLSDITQPIGLVNVYVHNGVGSTSGPLVAQAVTTLSGYVDGSGNKIPGWKAAGIHMVVAAASEVTIAVTAAVSVDAAYDSASVLSAVSGTISSYILSLNIGQTFLFSEAVALAMGVPGVLNIVFTTPTADHTATNSQKLMPGTFAITAA